MTFTEMLRSALASVIAFLPNLLAALIILAIGLLIASALGRITRRILDGIDLPRRHRVRQFFENESVLERLPHSVGRVVYWVVALITIGVAVDALQLAWLSAGMGRVLGYLPNVLAAAAILFGAYLIGNYLHRRAARRQAEADPEQRSSGLLPALLRAGIYAIAGFMALQELGIATTIVTSAFIIALGGIAIAAALAFGWGNRELAGRITRDWYDRRGRRGPEQPPGGEIETARPASPLPSH
jgi:small-conductance mechanosensitive channel